MQSAGEPELAACVILSTCQYSHFRGFSPDCTLHSAITHMIKVLERWSLM